MLLRFTTRTQPGEPSTKEDTRLPWGVVIQPYAHDAKLAAAREEAAGGAQLCSSEVVARCTGCGGYINRYSAISKSSRGIPVTWRCVLCDESNQLPKRYQTGSSMELPEFQATAVEYLMPADEAYPHGSFIFVVDLSCTEEFLELVKNSLLAALEGIPRGSAVAIVTYTGESVSVFDLSCNTCTLRSVLAVEGSPGLHQVLPTERFLVALDDESESRILGAIESLSSLRGEPSDSRPLQFTVAMLCDWVLSQDDLFNVRAAVFLSGPPSGLLLDPSGINPQSEFYRSQMERIVEGGLTFDLFVVSGVHCGLPSLKFLPQRTGGHLVLHGSVDESSLPQDIFKLYSEQCAYHTQLRLRCSADVAPKVCFNFESKENCDALYCVEACSTHHAFSMDLQFDGSSGSYGSHMYFQTAFAFNEKSLRILRVVTVRQTISLSWRLVYPSTVPECVMTLLTHKIMRSAFDEGIEEARALLLDWLTLLIVQYNDNMRLTKTNASINMGAFGNLKNLPRYVFALTKSPLMIASSNSDFWCALQNLCSRLPPVDLLRVIYPQLTTFSTIEKKQAHSISLNYAAVSASGVKWFVLDSFSTLLLYSTDEGEETEFPPPKSSPIRETIDNAKKSRYVTPAVQLLRKGDGGAQRTFESYLLEEGPGDTYVDFIQSLELKVIALLK